MILSILSRLQKANFNRDSLMESTTAWREMLHQLGVS